MCALPMSVPQYPDDGGYNDNPVFRWVDAMPEPRIGRSMQKEQIQGLFNAALAMPYLGEWNPLTQQYEFKDPNTRGMTNAEVMVYKQIRDATGDDPKARSDTLDRTLGKPKQAMEVASMHMSYSEFLEQSAQEAKAQQKVVIDIVAQHHQSTLPDADDEDLEDLIRGI